MPVLDSDGKECPSYSLTEGSSEIFQPLRVQISPTPATLPHSRKKLGVPAVAAVSRPPCIELEARKEEYFGLETEPTSTRRSQMKFQISGRRGSGWRLRWDRLG